MVLFIEKLFSLNTNRFIDGKYDLDLTYIFPRLIAMALPAQGIQSIYKNSIENVSQFLQEKHGNNYLIVNLGNHPYDQRFFEGNVITVSWADHEPINMCHLLRNVFDIGLKLLDNDQLIVAAHCRAGKGRTGTFVSCLILLFNIFDSIQDVKTYYEEKRQVTVTKKSQLKNISYFQEFNKGQILEKNFVPKIIQQVKISGLGEFGILKMIFINIDNQQIIFETQLSQISEGNFFTDDINFDLVQSTDISIIICYKRYMRWNKICKFYISSLFENTKAMYRSNDVEAKIKLKKDFKIEIFLQSSGLNKNAV